jgi:3-oxoacyl-[acyl-carrier protein] reductase
MSSSLRNKSVIVTGATRGIGKGIARVIASHGAKVLIVGRDTAAGAATVEACIAAGGTAKFFAADVGTREGAEAVAAAAVAAFGGIDVLCANAGIFPAAKLETMTEAQWDEVFHVNVRGMFLCVQACLPELKKSGAGRIVLTSSITGPITGFPGWSHYGATKSAQLGFMRTAAIELAKYGITINAVMPGNIATEGLAALGPDYASAAAAIIPLKRLGSVDDIGHAAAFFASKEAGYITGQALAIDGGQILPESPQALEA